MPLEKDPSDIIKKLIRSKRMQLLYTKNSELDSTISEENEELIEYWQTIDRNNLDAFLTIFDPENKDPTTLRILIEIGEMLLEKTSIRMYLEKFRLTIVVNELKLRMKEMEKYPIQKPMSVDLQNIKLRFVKNK